MAKYLNEDGVGLMLQNINNHINTKLSNYLPKTTPIPDEVELIEISGDMLADEPIYTAAEVQAIIDAYNANKLIALHNSATRNYGNGWFIPSIFVRSLQTIRQIYISGVIANFYIEQHFNYDTSSGSVATVYIDRKLDLSEIGGSSTYVYGTCSTGAATGTKTVTLPDSYSNFTVSTGSIVAVKFTYTNTVASTSLKLSVAGVTAQIKYLNTTFPSNQHWTAGSVVEFIYDGSAWQVLGNIRDNLGSDTKVAQTITTTNSTYPLLFSATANKSTSSADAARFSSNLKYNPSTDTLTVGNISSNIPGVTDGGASLLGTCDSTANSSEKNIDLSGVNLTKGSRVWIRFSNGNSYLGNMTCTINHKGTKITGAKISINGVVGGRFTAPPASIPGTQNSDYYSGIVFGTGYYEFIVEIISNVYYLRMTNNYIADSSPELHIKSGVTTNYNILMVLTPNVHTVFDNPGLTILNASTYPNRSYSFEFTSGTTAPTLTLPVDVKWANGTIPTWEANTTYHISIVNNCAVCASFKTVS